MTAWMLALLLSGASAPDDTVAVVDAVVLDGRGGVPLEEGTILVRDGRVVAVGADVDIPPGAARIDGRGLTAIPGLADMHVHLVGGWDGEAVDLLGYPRYLNALLYGGVTTVLDAGNVLPFVAQIHQEIESGRLEGPSLYFVGPLLDGADPLWPPISYVLLTVAQVPGVVDQLQAGGVSALKVYNGLSAPLVNAVVRAASAHSLPVLVDQGPRNGADFLTHAGIDAFAHAPTEPLDDASIALMKERGVRVVTTLAVLESFSRRRLQSDAFLEEPLIRDTTPPWFLDALREEIARPLSVDERARAERAAESLAVARANVKKLRDAGIGLAAGTDAPYPGVFQGEGIHRELELLVESGLTPLEALRAATAGAAELLGMEQEWGTIEPGKRADIVLVRGRPDRDVSATRRVEVVIRGGRVLDRERLRFDPARDPGFRESLPVSSHP